MKLYTQNYLQLLPKSNRAHGFLNPQKTLDSTHNQNFAEEFTRQLKMNMPEIVYIYSQNSAYSFLNFIKNERIEGLWKNTNLMCMGEKTSSILNEIKWKKIFLFNPGEEEFLLYKI